MPAHSANFPFLRTGRSVPLRSVGAIITLRFLLMGVAISISDSSVKWGDEKEGFRNGLASCDGRRGQRAVGDSCYK
ncbi:hypothetical protein BDZ88DRAFT_267723 [Geranomyces variabilis]|nr:hypothetical protein BDZ88DRAFT_267723 [Geranomyces variabilis]